MTTHVHVHAGTGRADTCDVGGSKVIDRAARCRRARRLVPPTGGTPLLSFRGSVTSLVAAAGSREGGEDLGLPFPEGGSFQSKDTNGLTVYRPEGFDSAIAWPELVGVLS